MVHRNHICTSIFAIIFAVHFCGFLFFIQHPRVHNITADLNYSEVDEYVKFDDESLPHQESNVHFHPFTKEPDSFCFVCNLLTSGLDNAYNANSYTFLEYKTEFVFFLEDEVSAYLFFDLPSLRAPPGV